MYLAAKNLQKYTKIDMNIIFLDFCLFLAVFGGLKKGKMAVGRSSMVGRNQLRNLNILLSAQLAEVEFVNLYLASKNPHK